MTEQQVLYSRSVSSAGRVRYDPVGIEAGCMKPGIWLVRDVDGGHGESLIAPICEVPTAIHAACLATFRDRLALAIAGIKEKTYSAMDLAEVCLDKLRELSPPIEVAGDTTKFYVCAGCGRPLHGVHSGYFAPMKEIGPGELDVRPANAQEGTGKADSTKLGSFPVPKVGRQPERRHGAANGTVAHVSTEALLSEASRQIIDGCLGADVEVRKIGGRVCKPYDIKPETSR